MEDDNETLRGNLHAMEFLIAQLFIGMREQGSDPQGWLANNYEHVSTLLDRRMSEGAMSEEMAEAAKGTVRRVMATAGTHFETVGKGPSQVSREA